MFLNKFSPIKIQIVLLLIFLPINANQTSVKSVNQCCDIYKQNSNLKNIVYKKISLIKKDLIEIIKKYKKDSITDTISIFGSLNSKGEFRFPFPISNDFESSYNQEISNLFKKIRLDSAEGYGFNANFNIFIDNNYNLHLPDTISFYRARLKEEIQCQVMKNVEQLKKYYNNYQKKAGTFSGIITVVFAIDEFGKVIHSSAIKSTTNKVIFDKEIARIISKWKFCRINKPGDVTEVTYPFSFSN
jgi:hypothetical protein